MSTWNDLLTHLNTLATPLEKQQFLDGTLRDYLSRLALRRGSNVLIYASGFLQKQNISPQLIQISPEDINGFMATINGMDFRKPLTLILHTPGGVMTATETIVEYLRSKFVGMEAIVPVYAMSGGTMIAMAADKIVMGRQSQLGPIDSQFAMQNGMSMSASSILAQFKRAKEEIASDKSAAAAWAPILASVGPSLIQSAQNALDCGQQMVQRWLEHYMFANESEPNAKALEVAEYFNSEDIHLNHGRRIGLDEAAQVGLNVEQLEEEQEFQDEVLTIYHIVTLMFEMTAAVKFMQSNTGKVWIKNAPTH